MSQSDSVVDAIDGLRDATARRGSAAGSIIGGAGDPSSMFETAAAAGPYEHVMVRTSVGTGTVMKDGNGHQHIIVTGKMFTLDGTEDGNYKAVFQAGKANPTPADLTAYPPNPEDTYTKPSPIPGTAGDTFQWNQLARTKARWTFANNSTLEAPGPAPSYIAPLKDGSVQFWVAAGAVITNGTGDWAGAIGQECSLGSTWFSAAPDLQEGTKFEAKVLHIFKVVKEPDRAPSPPQDPHTAIRQPLPGFDYQPKYEEIKGDKMYYVDEGKGKPILFLHGNPSWSYGWRKVIPYLTPSARCIAVDLMGFGRSDKPDIEYSFEDHVAYLDEFITTLKLKDITLVIQDWGSGLGFHYAARYPKNVRAIAFFEAMVRPYPKFAEFPGPESPQELRDLFGLFRNDGTIDSPGWKAIVEDNLFVGTLLPNSMKPKVLSPEELAFYNQPFKTQESRKPVWKFPQEIPIEEQPANVHKAVAEYSKWIASTDTPMLLFHASPGLILTPDHVEWCKDNITNLKHIHVGEGTHFLQESAPDLLGYNLRDWFTSL